MADLIHQELKDNENYKNGVIPENVLDAFMD
jgi:hypothetical protein